ncbi:tetratricopeptide repeat protein [Prosthecobacter fusiformis]|uniref:Tetratricopeptide repeat protein n=1 Tax=Prosthecobacter fusiformis TaxID=48464 RepID=A0A4V3FG16_9BACT|nr:tetratricopeptide repeat protein [Prosthecobacter fusiformis]TDU72903.1 tetratricopeptide repeat protein [Prosthecobacter fusiformis]
MNRFVFCLLLLGSMPLHAAPTHKAPYALELWSNPRFARYFVGTYGNIPDVEPVLSDADRQILQHLLTLMPKPLEAIQFLGKVVNKDSNAVFDYQVASLYFDNGMLDSSEEWFKTALEKFPTFRRAWRGQGMVQVKLEKWREAVTSLGTAIGLGVQDGPTYGLLGYALLSLERASAAESAYRQALMFDPDSLDWKMGLVRAVLTQLKAAEAAALCDEILRDHPERTELLSLQAEAYIAMKENSKATQNLEILVRGGQAKGDDIRRLGDIYLATGEGALALSAYTRWLERADKTPAEDVTHIVTVAENLSAQNSLPEATLLLAKAKEVSSSKLPPEAESRLLKVEARLQMAAGKGETAAPILQRVVELNPMDGSALMLLGQHFNDTNDPVKATAYYERATKIKDTEPDALIRLAQMNIANSKLPDALLLLKRSNDLKPRDSVQKLIQDLEKYLKKGTK